MSGVVDGGNPTGARREILPLGHDTATTCFCRHAGPCCHSDHGCCCASDAPRGTEAAPAPEYDLVLNERFIGTYDTAADAEEAKRWYVKTYGPPAGTFFIYERPPVAVPGPASVSPADAALRSLAVLLEAIDRGRALLPNGALLLEVDAEVNDGMLWRSDASMLLDQDDLAALRSLIYTEGGTMDVLDNAHGLGSAVAQALTEGAGAVQAARSAADALAAGDVEQAKACLSPYRDGHGTYASDLVYDHPAESVTDSMPAQPTGTTGY